MQKGEKMSKISVNKLPLQGICNDCVEKERCPMIFMLREHRENMKTYGEHYENKRPDLWEEVAIDEPEFKENQMKWCPMYADSKTL